MEKQIIKITNQENENDMATSIGTRIDVFISNTLEHLTRSHVQKLLQDEMIKVSGKVVKANYKLRANDIIELEEKEPIPCDIVPEKMPLNIVYEDDDLIIVNKERGMVVHPSCGHYSGTLVNGLMYHTNNNLSNIAENSINGVFRPGIVHRIDKDTSGVIVIAKNDKAHLSLSAQLKDHSMTRKYHGIVKGIVKEENGTIDKPIGRHPEDRKKMAIILNKDKKSKEAITHYKTIERLKNATYMEFTLETGRTHQIRVHMTSINHPLIGDYVYYNGNKNKVKNEAGQYLHAKILGFIHPSTNEYMEFETDLPTYFTSKLDKLK